MKLTVSKEEPEAGMLDNMRKIIKVVILDNDLIDKECIDEIIKILDLIKA